MRNIQSILSPWQDLEPPRRHTSDCLYKRCSERFNRNGKVHREGGEHHSMGCWTSASLSLSSPSLTSSSCLSLFLCSPLPPMWPLLMLLPPQPQLLCCLSHNDGPYPQTMSPAFLSCQAKPFLVAFALNRCVYPSNKKQTTNKSEKYKISNNLQFDSKNPRRS